MAKLIVYAVFDSKISTYAQPFFMRTKGEALRGWQEVANDPKTQISKYPGDFALMELGTYDESTGQFENHRAPVNCGLAIEYKSQEASNYFNIDDSRNNKPQAEKGTA